MKFIMKFWCFTGLFGLIGATFPIIFGSNYFNSIEFRDFRSLYRLMHVSCPPCILWLAEADSATATNPIMWWLSIIIANVLLYAFIGIFVWLGIRKKRAFFVIPALTLTAMCWWGIIFLK